MAGFYLLYGRIVLAIFVGEDEIQLCSSIVFYRGEGLCKALS